MLHQYNEKPYSDISNRYSSSSLNSCSYLLPQTCSKSSKVLEIDTKFISENNFLMRADTYHDAEYCNELRIAADIEKHFPALGTISEVELPANTMNEERNIEDDTNANQLVSAEQNNNVQKATTEDVYIKNREVFLEPKVLQIPVESRPNMSFNESQESRQPVNASNLCDQNETNFRLPGFHQAFGSTEIGRFVHQKDFIEQINHQQVSFVSTPHKPFAVPFSSPNTNNTNFPVSPKGRTKYDKRIKALIHARSSKSTASELVIVPRAPASACEMSRNPNWPYDEYDGNPMASPTSTNFQSPATYYNPNEQERIRRREHQYSLGNSPAPAAYCTGEDFYNCSSSFYYNGCSENANCDYYTRYHQNSTPYNLHRCSSVSDEFSSSHVSFSNGYHCNKDHTRYHTTSNDVSSSMNQQNYQNDRYFSSYNDPQLPYHYDKQSYQYQPSYTSHNQYSSQQLYSNYSSYTPVPSYNYY